MENISRLTDEELAISYVRGNNRAFDELLSRNQSKLFSYILFVVRDEDKANDLFQETFVKVITKLHQGRYVDSGNSERGLCALRIMSLWIGIVSSVRVI